MLAELLYKIKYEVRENPNTKYQAGAKNNLNRVESCESAADQQPGLGKGLTRGSCTTVL